MKTLAIGFLGLCALVLSVSGCDDEPCNQAYAIRQHVRVARKLLTSLRLGKSVGICSQPGANLEKVARRLQAHRLGLLSMIGKEPSELTDEAVTRTPNATIEEQVLSFQSLLGKFSWQASRYCAEENPALPLSAAAVEERTRFLINLVSRIETDGQNLMDQVGCRY
jgi:hypothetical protein